MLQVTNGYVDSGDGKLYTVLPDGRPCLPHHRLPSGIHRPIDRVTLDQNTQPIWHQFGRHECRGNKQQGHVKELYQGHNESPFRVNKAIALDSAEKPAANRAAMSRMVRIPGAPLGERAPNNNPATRIIPDWIVTVSAACSTREAMKAPRCMGVASVRSNTPSLWSSISPIPDHAEPNSAAIITTPGVRNWIYEAAPNPGNSTTRRKSWP